MIKVSDTYYEANNIMNKPTIVFLIDSSERINFFSKIASELSGKYNSVFIATSFSSFIKAKRISLTVYLIRRYPSGKRIELANDYQNIAKNSYELKIGSLNEDQISVIYNSYYDLADQIKKQHHNIKGIVVWNGQLIDGRAFTRSFERFKPNTLYFELANIPNKIQMDTDGVNAKSSIYLNAKILDALEEPRPEFYSWKKEFIKEKLLIHNVPQSKNVKEINYWYLVDHFYNRFSGRPANQKTNNISSVIENFKNKFIRDTHILENKSIFDINQPFIFFPLQVSDDTQCILNSDISIEDAINRSLEISKQEQVPLVVKRHPAEKNINFVNHLIQSFENDIIVSDLNTFQLINQAKLVITINSSVGLEAKILGKEVIVLGKAVYSEFTESQLNKYLDKYLLEADYWGNLDIATSSINRIIHLLSQNNNY